MDSFNEILVGAVDSLFNTLVPITATYKNTDGVTRDIEALVFYKNEEPKDGRTRAKYPVPNVIVKNGDTVGISSDEIDTGGDTIQMPIWPMQPELAQVFEAIERWKDVNEGKVEYVCHFGAFDKNNEPKEETAYFALHGTKSSIRHCLYDINENIQEVEPIGIGTDFIDVILY